MQQFEALSDKLFLAVSKAHRFGTDAFLLARFAAPKHKDKLIDLGCGCGIIPMVCQRDYQPKELYGIDIQPEAVALFEASVQKSHGCDNVHPIFADLRKLPQQLCDQSFDVVTCNPPYFANGAGFLSADASHKRARHEVCCTALDVCKAAAKLLKFGGRLCVCQRPQRLVDVLDAMRQQGIEPKRLQFVAKNADTPPWLCLVEGKKGAQPFLTVEPTLCMESLGNVWQALAPSV